MRWSLGTLSLVVVTLISLLPSSHAVYVDEAYHVDFHYSLLGQPLANSTFFHQPYPGSKASLLYTLSEKGVLGAVNPKDGEIVWRQRLEQNTFPSALRAAEGLDVLVSARGSRVAAWTAVDGRLAWEQTFEGSEIKDVHILREAGSVPSSVIVAASNDDRNTIVKLDAATGDRAWTFEDTSGDEPYRLASTPTKIYLTSFHKALLKGLKIKVASVDTVGGKVIDEYTLSSDGDISTPNDVLGLTANTDTPIIAWAGSTWGSIKANVLGARDIQTLDTKSMSTGLVKLPELSATGNGKDFVINYQGPGTNWAETFRVEGSSIKRIWDIKAYNGEGLFSATTTTGQNYFVRITESELVLDSATERLAAWTIKDWGVSGLLDRVTPLQVTAEVAAKGSASYSVRAAVLLSSGDWILVRNGETSWYRPEALAGIVRAVWADPQPKLTADEAVTYEKSVSPVQAVIYRIKRHANVAQRIPALGVVQAMAANLVRRLLASSDDASFGFDKRIIVATDNGRLVALDMGQRGKMAWSVSGLRQLASETSCASGLPWTSKSLTSVENVLNCVMKGVDTSHAPGGPNQTFPSSTMLETEESVETVAPKAPLTSGKQFDAVTIKYKLENGMLQGSRAGGNTKAWEFTPYKSFQVHSVVPSNMDKEPIASIGKALGDRNVLYKYLNPNLVAVVTTSELRKSAAVILLDGVAGSVLWTTTLDNVDISRPIGAVMTENWLAMSYTMDAIEDHSVSKGFQILMTEFYESQFPNDRGGYGSAQNYSMTAADASAVKPYAFSQSYHIPEEISNMAVTQTAQGITSRMLLASLPRTNSIVSIPPQLLDPRRVVGKDPTTDQMMEGLSRYTPMIDFDPRWYLNHREEILGLTHIKTTPALLESTSLAFAYGLDVFGTRVTPSFAFDILGSSFNKIQLSFIVAGLFIGVLAVGPLIQRKQTNMLWQST